MSQPKKTIDHVTIRSYPKTIFLWPLLLVSFVLWLLQLLYPDPVSIFGFIWMGTFFVNVFILAFDFSSAKFFVLIMVVVVVILLFIFLILPNVSITFPGGEDFNFGITAIFYAWIALLLLLLWGLTWLSTRFDYYKIERNEIYHKSGIFSSAERLPTKSLRIKKEIPDVFEFFLLRSGRITLLPGHGDVIPLNNVLNINKKEDQIDWLLSHISIEPDELDA